MLSTILSFINKHTLATKTKIIDFVTIFM